MKVKVNCPLYHATRHEVERGRRREVRRDLYLDTRRRQTGKSMLQLFALGKTRRVPTTVVAKKEIPALPGIELWPLIPQ
jgi:hypothetical protein